MVWHQNRIRLGRRDRFWFGVTLIVIAILFVLRMLSHDGFSGPGKPVWKSANLGSDGRGGTALDGRAPVTKKSSIH